MYLRIIMIVNAGPPSQSSYSSDCKKILKASKIRI